MALFFITGSKHKFAEVQAILPQVEQMEMELQEIQELDPHKIIAAKLFEARMTLRHGSTLMVEDTSLYLNALNGLPGPFIKWFLQTLGPAGLYKLAATYNEFGATVKTIIGYVDELGKVSFFEGELSGSIVSPRGDSAFGFDPVFQPEGHTKTFAEMTKEEKTAISHRGITAKKLKVYLEQTK